MAKMLRLKKALKMQTLTKDKTQTFQTLLKHLLMKSATQVD